MSQTKGKSIIRRWLSNNVALIVFILMVVVWAVGTSVQAYYYNSITKIMETRAMVIINSLESIKSHRDVDYYDFLSNHIENFDAKDQIELMVLDQNQNIIISSRGFYSDESYIPVSTSNIANGTESGRTTNNEHYLALTYAVPENNQDIKYIRLVTSLNLVDTQIRYIVAIVTLIGIGVIFLVTYSGMYFIKSIVIPVSQVSNISRKIAMGDFSTKLDINSHDEIGELCESINYMAEKLSEADKIKNDFISSVSHELRTPLTAIRGWAETISYTKDEDKETLEKGMKVILSETERLGSMVEELLDFSRIQSGNFSMIMREIDVLAELEETVIMFAERARREGVKLNIEEPEYISPMMGDGNRLKQVFVNIIDNALKYTDNGDTIDVVAQEEDDNIIIRIIDSGCGIEAHDLPEVKNRFYKGTGARRGSGIGLSLVDEIIKRHNGNFDIDSIKDVGTTVTIILPTINNEINNK